MNDRWHKDLVRIRSAFWSADSIGATAIRGIPRYLVQVLSNRQNQRVRGGVATAFDQNQ
jgi:hypothetical protein